MKNIILSLTLLLFSVTAASAQMGMMGSSADSDNVSASVDQLTSQIMAEQNVTSLTNLDCTKISDDTLEELGDQVMSYMHPDSDIHEAMDDMMGGEGSESLAAAHINMALNYLGCNTYTGTKQNKNTGYGMLGMMNYSRSNDWGYTFRDMHHFQSGNWLWNLHLVFMTITWLVVMALLVALTRYFWKKGK